MKWYKLLSPTWLIETFFILRGGDDKGGDAPDVINTPTKLTTGYGSANYNPATGNVGYTLNPFLSSIRDYYYNQVNNFKPTEQQTQMANDVYNYGTGLFSRGSNLDVNKLTQDYYNQNQAALAPNRALEEARLGDTLFKSGRTGAGTGYAGGGYINPEQFSLLKAREQQNAELMLGSEDRARNLQQMDLTNGLRFMDAGQALRLQPLQSMSSVLGLGTGVENLGYNQLAALGQFGGIQQQRDNAAYQAALAQSQDEGKMGGLMGGIVGGASSVFGQGLGQWASGIFGNKSGGTGGWGSAVGSFFGPWGTAAGTVVDRVTG
jgi:hypothetical protein